MVGDRSLADKPGSWVVNHMSDPLSALPEHKFQTYLTSDKVIVMDDECRLQNRHIYLSTYEIATARHRHHVSHSETLCTKADCIITNHNVLFSLYILVLCLGLMLYIKTHC